MKVLGGEIVSVHLRLELDRFEEGLVYWMLVSSKGIVEESTRVWRVQILGGEMVSLGVYTRIGRNRSGALYVV